MAKEQGESEVVTVEYEFETGVVAGIMEVAKRRKISLEKATQRLLAAGLLIKAVNYAGGDVVGKFPDGTEQMISKAT